MAQPNNNKSILHQGKYLSGKDEKFTDCKKS